MIRYASIDIETTGLDPATCQIIEVACVIETDWQTPLDQLPTLHLLVEHAEYRGQAYALGLNARILNQLGRQPESRACPTATFESAAGLLEDFLFAHLGKGPWTAAGKNFSTFDLRFLERLPNWSPRWFRHRVIDPAVMWLDPAADGRVPDTPTCLKRAGVVNANSHHAVHDAQAVIELIRRAFAGRPATSRPACGTRG